MSSAIDRERTLPPTKSKLQSWQDRANASSEAGDVQDLLTEGYALLFGILDPIAKEGSIDPDASVEFSPHDHRLRHFYSEFLGKGFADNGRASIKSYKGHSPRYSGVKQATILFSSASTTFGSKSITVAYEYHGDIRFSLPRGMMRIEENSVAWVRPDDTKTDIEQTKSLTELPPLKLLGLALSIAHVYSEDRKT